MYLLDCIPLITSFIINKFRILWYTNIIIVFYIFILLFFSLWWKLVVFFCTRHLLFPSLCAWYHSWLTVHLIDKNTQKMNKNRSTSLVYLRTYPKMLGLIIVPMLKFKYCVHRNLLPLSDQLPSSDYIRLLMYISR